MLSHLKTGQRRVRLWEFLSKNQQLPDPGERSKLDITVYQRLFNFDCKASLLKPSHTSYSGWWYHASTKKSLKLGMMISSL